MAGVKRVALSDRDAEEFRKQLERRKKDKKLTTDEIINSGERQRSRRWFYRAMDGTEPLPIANAVDLAERMQKLDARLPDAVVRKLQEPGPVLLIPKGEADSIATRLVQMFDLPKPTSERVERLMAAFFKSYERFAETPTGTALFFRLKSEMGGDDHWRQVFEQIRRGRVTTVNGKIGVETPSSLTIAKEQFPPTTERRISEKQVGKPQTKKSLQSKEER